MVVLPGYCPTGPALPASCIMYSSGFPKHPFSLRSPQGLHPGNMGERTKPCALKPPSLKRKESVCTTLVLGNAKLHRKLRMSSKLLGPVDN